MSAKSWAGGCAPARAGGARFAALRALLTGAFLINVVVSQIVQVSTFAGDGEGFADGASSSFRLPRGLVFLSSGNAYVADSGNNRIRYLVPSGAVTTVSTFAGADTAGWVDGSGTNARFFSPNDVALNSTSGSLYVADTGNNRIRAVTVAGAVITIAGNGQPALLDAPAGPGTSASFSSPTGVAVDGLRNNVYVADKGNNRIRKLELVATVWRVTSLAGGATACTTAMACDGTGTGASFNGPTDLAFVDPTFSELYVADQDIHRIRKVSVISGQVTTLAGSGAPASNDGFGTGASFSSPSGVVVDTSGNLVVADSGNNLMRKVTPAGVVTTLAGSGVSGNADGTSAAFKKPSYVAFWQGTTSIGPALYVSDENHRIRKLVCAPGTWASSSVTMCDFCAAGKFGKEAGVKTPSCNGDCIEGHFCLLGSTTATQFPCPAGRFGNASGLSDPTCTDFCSAGYYGTSGQGQVMASCQGQCSAGYFCPMGSISSQGSTNAAPAPNPCPAGKFGPPPTVVIGSISNVTLTVTASISGALTVGAVLSGTTLNGTRVAAKTRVLALGSGSRYTVSVPQYVPAGTTLFTAGLDSADSCHSCALGHYGATTALTTSNCSGLCACGTYGNSVGLTTSSCSGLCAAGRYGLSTTNRTDSNCDGACPAGYYCPTGSCEDKRFLCPAGRYGSSAGLTDATCNGPCSAGYFCEAASTSPVQKACPTGSYCVAGSGAPTPCPAGTYQANTAQSSCTPCGLGFTSFPGNTSCFAFTSTPDSTPVATTSGASTSSFTTVKTATSVNSDSPTCSASAATSPTASVAPTDSPTSTRYKSPPSSPSAPSSRSYSSTGSGSTSASATSCASVTPFANWSAAPSGTPRSSLSAYSTASSSSVATARVRASASGGATRTVTGTGSETGSGGDTRSASATASPKGSASDTCSVSSTASSSGSASSTRSSSASHTSTATVGTSPRSSESLAASASGTLSASPTNSAPATGSARPTISACASATSSACGSARAAPTASVPPTPSASLSRSTTRTITITMTGSRSFSRTPSPSGSVGALASASPRPPPVAVVVLTVPWCAPGAVAADGALSMPLRAGVAQAAGVLPSVVTLTGAACQNRRSRAAAAGAAIMPGVPMLVTLTVADVAEFLTQAGDLLASGAPARRPGAYFVGGDHDTSLQMDPIALAVSKLAADQLALALGEAMGCGSSGAAGTPAGGGSASPLEPFGAYFAAFSAAAALPPEYALSCATGALRVYLKTPTAPVASGDAAAASTLQTIVIAGATGSAILLALLAAFLVRLRARARARAALTEHPSAPTGARSSLQLTNQLRASSRAEGSPAAARSPAAKVGSTTKSPASNSKRSLAATAAPAAEELLTDSAGEEPRGSSSSASSEGSEGSSDGEDSRSSGSGSGGGNDGDNDGDGGRGFSSSSSSGGRRSDSERGETNAEERQGAGFHGADGNFFLDVPQTENPLVAARSRRGKSPTSAL